MAKKEESTKKKPSAQSKKNTVKTTKSPKKSKKKNSKKKKINYAGASAGLLTVCIIMFTVFFFINPSIKNNTENKNAAKLNQTEINKKNPLSKKKDKEKTPLSNDKKNSALKPAISEKTKKNDSKPAKEPVSDKSKNSHISDKAKTPVQTEKPKEQEKDNTDDTSSYPIPDLPELPSKGQLIFVFDDAGHSLEHLQYFIDLPFPCTIAVLPKLANSRETAKRIRNAGKEVILHQPMQAVNPNIDPGPGAIKPGMSSDEITAILVSNIQEIAPIAGMNNHEGSLITSDESAMQAVLKLCRKKNIYFLDSRTSADTVVPSVAKKLNMSIWERSIFIDNKKDKEYMKKQITDGLEIASYNGTAIMIGHVFTIDLAILLKELYPDLINAGYSFATISKLEQ